MWHFYSVTGLLESYAGLPPQVAMSMKRNFSLPEDWLAGCFFFFFCVVHKICCLFGRALLPTSPAAAPTDMPSSSFLGKKLQGAAKQGCERLHGQAAERSSTWPRSPWSIPLPGHVPCTEVQIGGHHDCLYGGGWVAPSFSLWRWLGMSGYLGTSCFIC